MKWKKSPLLFLKELFLWSQLYLIENFNAISKVTSHSTHFFLNRHAGRRGIHAPNELQRLHASRNVFQVVLSYLWTDDYGIKNEAKVALETERWGHISWRTKFFWLYYLEYFARFFIKNISMCLHFVMNWKPHEIVYFWSSFLEI